jgi:hypothetical protein
MQMQRYPSLAAIISAAVGAAIGASACATSQRVQASGAAIAEDDQVAAPVLEATAVSTVPFGVVRGATDAGADARISVQDAGIDGGAHTQAELMRDLKHGYCRLPPAEEHLSQRVARGGTALPAGIGCVVAIEPAVPVASEAPAHGGGAALHTLNRDAHPKRVAARYGTCSPAATREILLRTAADPTHGELIVERGGAVVPAMEIVPSLLPLNTPEKLALYLELGMFAATASTSPTDALPNASICTAESNHLFVRGQTPQPTYCYGATAFEYARAENGDFLVLGVLPIHASEGLARKPYRARFNVDVNGVATLVACTPIPALVTPTREAENKSHMGNGRVVVGRAYEGYYPIRDCAALGAYFDSLAQDEAASVVSFLRLSVELAAHGAALSLVARCEAAAGEELRHYLAMRALTANGDASALAGAHLEEAVYAAACERAAAFPVRSLIAIARENRVEGCISETYSAALAGYQAAAAVHAGFRRAMQTIAVEETSHAQLAWDIDAWCMEMLTALERQMLDSAADERMHALCTNNDVPCPTWAKDVALPDAAARAALLRSLQSNLWSARAA